jgi:hypothetical protein
MGIVWFETVGNIELVNYVYRTKIDVHSQLPNFSGQAWASIGKSSSCIGHSAAMVNLEKENM